MGYEPATEINWIDKINETTVAAPGTLAGRPQFKVPGQPATL